MDFTNITNFIKKNSATILSGVGIGALVTTTVVTVPVTAKVTRKIVAKEQELERPLTFKEKFKLAWKNYIPVALGLAGGSTSAILGQKQASQTAAAFAAELTKESIKLADYEQKVKETLGEETAKKIQNDISKDKLEQKFGKCEECSTNLVFSEDTKVKYLDEYSGRTFMATPAMIDDIINRINYRMNDDDYISINDIYDIINYVTGSNLDGTLVGGLLGFRRADGLIEKRIYGMIYNGYPVANFALDREPMEGYDE